MAIMASTNRASVIHLQEDEKRNSNTYLIIENHWQRTTYATTLIHQSGTHKCGYLNVDRETYLSIDDYERFALAHDVSYAGISSDLLVPSAKILSQTVIPLNNYWIGIDYMGAENQMPDESEIVNRLAQLYSAYLDRTITG